MRGGRAVVRTGKAKTSENSCHHLPRCFLNHRLFELDETRVSALYLRCYSALKPLGLEGAALGRKGFRELAWQNLKSRCLA
jgi:hypothetical protein